MLVNLKQPSVYHLPDGQRLNPGMNNVKIEDWKAHREHPIIKILLESGDIEEEIAFEEVEANGDTDGSEALKGLRFNAARSMIKETMDVELLNKWLASEEKDTVKALIVKQIEALAAPLDKRDRNKTRQITTGKGPEHVELEVTPNSSDD